MVGVPLRGSVLMSMQLEVRLVGVPLRGTVLFGAMRRPRLSADGLGPRMARTVLAVPVGVWSVGVRLRGSEVGGAGTSGCVLKLVLPTRGIGGTLWSSRRLCASWMQLRAPM